MLQNSRDELILSVAIIGDRLATFAHALMLKHFFQALHVRGLTITATEVTEPQYSTIKRYPGDRLRLGEHPLQVSPEPLRVYVDPAFHALNYGATGGVNPG